MFFLDVVIASAIAFAIGFCCGSDWRDKKTQPHMQFLRECAGKWNEKYTRLLMQRIRDENKSVSE